MGSCKSSSISLLDLTYLNRLLLTSALQVAKQAWRRSIHSWVYVPIGILCILVACWGVDSLIGLSSVSFPASVALMIVLFFGLIFLERFVGEKKIKRIVQVIDVPVRVFNCFCPQYGVDYSIRLGSL